MPQSGSSSLRDGVSVIWERLLPSALTVKMSRSPVVAEKRAKMIFCPSGDQDGWLQPSELGSENAPPHDSIAIRRSPLPSEWTTQIELRAVSGTWAENTISFPC